MTAEKIAGLEGKSHRLNQLLHNNIRISARERFVQESRHHDIEAELSVLRVGMTEEVTRREYLEGIIKELSEENTIVVAEKDQLKLALAEVEEEVASVKGDRDSLRSSVAIITKERDDLTVSFDHIHEELSRTTEVYNGLRNSIVDIRNESASTIRKLSSERNEIALSLNISQGKLGKAVAERDKLRAGQEAEKEFSAKSGGERDEIAISLTWADATGEQNRRIIANLNASLFAEVSRSRELERAHEACQQEAVKLFQQCRRLSSSNDELMNEKAHLKEDLESAATHNLTLRQKIRSKDAKLVLTTALLQSSRDEIFSLHDRLDYIKARMSSNLAVVTNMERRHSFEVGILNNSVIEVLNRLDAELAQRLASESKIKELEVRLQHQRNEFETRLQTEQKLNAFLEERLQFTRDQLAVQKSVADEAKLQLSAERALSDSLAANLTEVSCRLDAANAQTLSLAHEPESDRKAPSKRQEAIEALFEGDQKAQLKVEQEKESIAVELAKAQSKIYELSDYIRRYTDEITSVRSQLHAEREAHIRTQDSLNVVHSRLDLTLAEKAHCRSILAKVEKQHGDACNEVVRLSENVRRMSRDLKQANEDMERLQSEVTINNTSDEDLRLMVSALTKESTSLRTSKKSVEDAFAHKLEQCEELQLEVFRLMQTAVPAQNSTNFPTPSESTAASAKLMHNENTNKSSPSKVFLSHTLD